MDIETVGSRIRYFREQRKLSQTELAALIGVTQKDISRWENDTYTPSFASMMKIAKALKTPIGKFADK